jgi:hypothetical protein
MKPHPGIRKATTWGGAAAVWIGVSVALSAALGVLAQLWDNKAPADDAVLFASGPIFAIYVTGCLVAGGVRRPSVLIPVFLYGALFPAWGLLLGAILFFIGGMFGVPQAIITALVFRNATKSWIPGIGAILGLALGWGIQATCVHDQVLRWGLVIFPWHATVIAALVVWAVTRREVQTRVDRGLCQTCRYDRTGIAADAKCPECGAIPTGR